MTPPPPPRIGRCIPIIALALLGAGWAVPEAALPNSQFVHEGGECNVEPYHRSWGHEYFSATMTVGQAVGTCCGYVEGEYGDLSKKEFQRPDGYPNDFGDEPAVDRKMTAVAQNQSVVQLQIKPGWLEGDLIPHKDVLRVCDETVVFEHVIQSNESSDFVLSTYAGEDWRRFASPRVRMYYDDAPPEFVSAQVYGRSLAVTFSEEVIDGDGSQNLPSAEWTVSGAGSVEAVTLGGRIVTLTLSEPVARGTSVGLSFAKSTNRPRDRSLNELASFGPETVRVVAKPALRSQALAADGTTLTLTFDEDLDGASVPPAGAFTVRVGGAVRPLAPVNPVAVAGRTVVLRLASPAGAGEAVTVAYENPNPN